MKIKKTLLRKSMIATCMLVLAFSFTATNILFVNADAGGTGKFLKVGIVGEGYVNATKVKSGEYWTFYWNDTQKVGAGIVLLEAFADEGWNFSCWKGDLSGNSNPTEYKTQKYGNVTAIFVQITYTITARAIGPGTINNTDLLTVEVEHGAASPLFVFAPTNPVQYDIALIKVDTDYILYTTSYAFPDPITSNHNINVTFDEIGIATVPDDSNVRSLIDSIASAMFNDTEGGTLIGIALDFPPGTSLFLYDLATDATDADGWILIALQLNGATPVNLTKGPSVDALYADIDKDYDVDGTDVSLVANAIKSLVPQGEYDEDYDVDRNGVLDELDILTVNENKGAMLTAIDFWIVEGTLYFLNPNNDWCCFRFI